MVIIEIGLSTLVVFVPASLALVVAPGPDSLYSLPGVSATASRPVFRPH